MKNYRRGFKGFSGKRSNYKNNYEFIDSSILNSQTYIDYLNRFKQVALTQFEWINLPDSMNGDYLELCLYLYGEASLLKDEKYGFINTQCCTNGKINIYGLPSSLHCYSYEYQTDRKLYTGLIPTQTEYEACILVKNNIEKLPTAQTMELFALRLYEAERTCDVNIKAQKTPIMLKGDENLRLTLENLYNKYNGNDPVVIVDKNQLGNEAIECVKTEAPFIADKLMIYKQQIWNEALTFLGIDNVANEKKERLVESEASSNNEIVNLNLQSRLQTRKYACKQFNEYFGLTGTDKEIDVKVRSDLHNVIKLTDSITVIEDDEKLEKNKKEEIAKEVIK